MSGQGQQLVAAGRVKDLGGAVFTAGYNPSAIRRKGAGVAIGCEQIMAPGGAATMDSF